MGGGSTQQGNTGGQSASTSNFASNPLNVSNPPLFGLGSDVGRLFGMMSNNFNAQGTDAANGSPISPYYGPAGAYNNVNTNPFVAGMTPGQTGQLQSLNQQTDPNAQGPRANATGSAGALNYAANNQGGIPGFAGQSGAQGNLAALGGNPWAFGGPTAGIAANDAMYGNFGQGQAGAAGGFAGNSGNFGGGLANQAGGMAGQIMPNAFNPLQAGTQTALNGQYGGGAANQAMGVAQNRGFGTGLANQAGQFAGANQNLQPAGQTLRREMDPNFAANLATSPETQRVIQEAENPILNSFNTQTIPGLQGTFSAAGQRLGSGNQSGVGGSSAFDIAGANALTGLGANLGATAASIANPTYQTGLGISAAAPGQFAALQQQKLSGMESAATTKMQTDAQKVQSLDQASLARLQVTTGKSQQELAAAAAAGTLTAQESAALASASGAATGAGAAQAGAMTGAAGAQTAAGSAGVSALLGAAGQQTAAGTAQTGANVAAGQTAATQESQYVGNLATNAQVNQGISSQQASDTINALNANALPQMTSQYGINQGISMYNSQMQQLMTMMGIGGQMAQPTVGNVSFGTGTSSGTSSGQSSGKGFSIL